MKKKTWLLIFGALITCWVCAQDPAFSQYYSAPLFLNPAFAGSTPSYRFISNYRNQWPGVGAGFKTAAFSFDMMLPELRSGVGVLFMSDQAGTASLKSNVMNLLYSYKISTKSGWVISPGLSFGLGRRSIDFNKLLFYDQLNLDGTQTPSGIIFTPDPKTYFDFGAGMLIYNSKMWIGGSANHLNEPNRSIVDGVTQLPLKWSIHGGMSFRIKNLGMRGRTAVLLPSFNYKSQGRFDQLDIGTYLMIEPVVFGLWYRGIPIHQDVADNVSQDAVMANLGFKLSKFDIMYSYDITVSKLGTGAGGAHEISIKYEINRLKRQPKKGRFIPCPAFYHNHDLNLEKLKQ